MQDCSNSIANALELLQSYTNALKYSSENLVSYRATHQNLGLHHDCPLRGFVAGGRHGGVHDQSGFIQTKSRLLKHPS